MKLGITCNADVSSDGITCNADVSSERVRQAPTPSQSAQAGYASRLDSRGCKVLNYALHAALIAGKNYIAPEHLLAGIAEEERSDA